MRCAVTGANGFLGGLLATAFVRAGWDVRALVRHDNPQLGRAGIASIRYDLLEDGVPALSNLDLLVHAARTTAGDNVDAARRLFAAARAGGVGRIAFISSLAAQGAQRSAYAREKRAIEALLDPQRDLIVRPGLVIGDGGLFGAMTRAVRRFPFAPLPVGEFSVYTIAAEKFVASVVTLVERAAPGCYTLCASEPSSLRDLYRDAIAYADTRCAIVPIPYGVLLALATIAGWLHMPAVPVESVRGLLNLRTVPERP